MRTCLAMILVGVSSSATAACGDEAQLIVELHTDYVPGVEFSTVRTDIVDAAVEPIDASAVVTDDFLGGRVVAELTGVPTGTARLRVTLLRTDTGAPLVERSVRVPVDGDTVVTVVLARTPQECADASTCVPAATCAVGRCVSGQCLAAPRDGVCAITEWCEPTMGCLPSPTIVDAGVGGP